MAFLWITPIFIACCFALGSKYVNGFGINSPAIGQSELIAKIFPQTSKLERRRFQLLKRAYIEARYSEHYKITAEELAWLSERVQQLQSLIEKLCKEKIDEFDG